MMCKR